MSSTARLAVVLLAALPASASGAAAFAVPGGERGPESPGRSGQLMRRLARGDPAADSQSLLEQEADEDLLLEESHPNGEPGMAKGWLKEVGLCSRRDGKNPIKIKSDVDLVNAGKNAESLEACGAACEAHVECEAFEVAGDPSKTPVGCVFFAGLHIGNHDPGHYCYLSLKVAQAAGIVFKPTKAPEESTDVEMPRGPPGPPGPPGPRWDGKNESAMNMNMSERSNRSNHSGISKGSNATVKVGSDVPDGLSDSLYGLSGRRPRINKSTEMKSKDALSEHALEIIASAFVVNVLITVAAFKTLQNERKQRMEASAAVPAEGAKGEGEAHPEGEMDFAHAEGVHAEGESEFKG